MSIQGPSHIDQAAGSFGVGIGEIGPLYRELAPRLERIVGRVAACPDAVVEDACQFAWSRLIQHRRRVCRETVLAWLARTAIREAFKLVRRNARELSLDAVLDDGVDPVSFAPELWELVVQRERLANVSELAARPQRIVWLQVLGLSYAEMAAHERCTVRTVDRQLTRARGALHAMAA